MWLLDLFWERVLSIIPVIEVNMPKSQILSMAFRIFYYHGQKTNIPTQKHNYPRSRQHRFFPILISSTIRDGESWWDWTRQVIRLVIAHVFICWGKTLNIAKQIVIISISMSWRSATMNYDEILDINNTSLDLNLIQFAVILEHPLSQNDI